MMNCHLLSRESEAVEDIESGVTNRGEEGLVSTTTLKIRDFLGGEDAQNHTPSLVEDKQKKKKKACMKPPRPPKSPFLDATDLKFVQELTELAIRRRARIERIKALKKTKATKSSWSSTISAFIITIMFCLFLFQGIGTRSNGSQSSQGSPAPAVAATGDFVSVQISNNFRPVFEDYGAGTGNHSSSTGQASVSGLRKK